MKSVYQSKPVSPQLTISLLSTLFTMLKYLYIFAGVLATTSAYSQAPSYSTSVLTYNYDEQSFKDNKPVPFDNPFTLVVSKKGSADIVAVQAFEAVIKNGVRDLAPDVPPSTPGGQPTSIKDVDLKFNVTGEDLYIYFPAIKPNKAFDVHIISKLSSDKFDKLLDINALLADSKDISSKFREFYLSLVDKLTSKTYFAFNATQYKVFYNTKLASTYADIVSGKDIKSDNDLTLLEFQAINSIITKAPTALKRTDLMADVIIRGLLPNIQKGEVDIVQTYNTSSNATSTKINNRIQNLKSNIKYTDSLYHKLNSIIANGTISTTRNTLTYNLINIRDKVFRIHENSLSNYDILTNQLKKITQETGAECNIKQAFYLSGNTVASDLKTKGGNVLFLDAGLTAMTFRGIDNKLTTIPRLYWGASIYFRPINKNTRLGLLPKKIATPNSDACQTVDPDYQILAVRDFRQSWSLNIGFTLGAIPNRDFDNLYNSTSLLVGPAYRFARTFKVSAGLALIKRTSMNPDYSEKRVVPGGYVSLSTDIDFIQGLKDITQILFK